MTLADLLPHMPLQATQAAIDIGDLVLDSRAVTTGDAFVAIVGDAADGRDFIDAAFAAGACVVLAEAAGLDATQVARYAERLVAVDDLRARLGELAARFYGADNNDSLLVGVTGTNGKTSVAWFMRQALEATGTLCGLVGTLGMQFADLEFNAGRTTPDVLSLQHALQQFRAAGATACAMEVSSHALMQGRIDALPISVAIFTNLSRDHLDYHGSMEAYFAAKARLFQRDGIELAVINRDDERADQLLGLLPPTVRAVTYGVDKAADIGVNGWQADKRGMTVQLRLPAGSLECHLPLYGAFNLSNVLAVVAALHGLGHDRGAIGQALAALKPVPGRMQQVPAGQGPTVLVDYAHTPDGLEKALTAAHAHFSGKLWCVVGCGGNRDKGKRPQMAAIAERLADRVVLTSDNPRNEAPGAILDDMVAGLRLPAQAHVEVDRAKAISQVVAMAADSDLILIAGKGHETWQEVCGQKLPMDDRRLAYFALQEWRAPDQGDAPCT